jgi:hypothetical protein
LHVLIVVRVPMRVPVVVIAMIVSVIVPVAMVRMAKRCKTHDVDEEAESADYQQLVEPMELGSFPQPLNSIKYDLDAD